MGAQAPHPPIWIRHCVSLVSCIINKGDSLVYGSMPIRGIGHDSFLSNLVKTEFLSPGKELKPLDSLLYGF